jgi:hypothetical protein
MEKRLNGGLESFKRIVASIVVILIAGWIGWVSVCSIASDRRLSVVESAITYISADITEMKGLVKDIRNDQIRRSSTEKRR